jgi:hypothetical protein
MGLRAAVVKGSVIVHSWYRLRTIFRTYRPTIFSNFYVVLIDKMCNNGY